MTLLDTNVLSELMRARPEPAVVEWLDAQPPGEVFVSAVTEAEIRLGVALLPQGARKTRLTALADDLFRDEFEGTSLAFTSAAASHYARLVSVRVRQGRPITVEDAQIAAIALSLDLTLATRNVRDFEEIDGLRLANPWTVSS